MAKSRTFTIEFPDGRSSLQADCIDELDAKSWVESVLAQYGHDPNRLVSGDWDQDGYTRDDKQRWRMLFWATEEDADNDSGANSICQLCAED